MGNFRKNILMVVAGVFLGVAIVGEAAWADVAPYYPRTATPRTTNDPNPTTKPRATHTHKPSSTTKPRATHESKPDSYDSSYYITIGVAVVLVAGISILILRHIYKSNQPKRDTKKKPREAQPVEDKAAEKDSEQSQTVDFADANNDVKTTEKQSRQSQAKHGEKSNVRD